MAGGVRHVFLGSVLDARDPEPDWFTRIGLYCNAPLNGVLLLNQIHSDLIEEMPGTDYLTRQRGGHLPSADGWIVDRADLAKYELAVAIKTADCFPVIVIDTKSTLSAVLHCGWKSSVLGILPKALARLESGWGISPSRCQVALGPGISREQYPVGEDVAAEIEAASSGLCVNHKSLRPVINEISGEICADVGSLLIRQAISSGVRSENIVESGICTYNSRDCFSHRRDAEMAGRQLTILA